MAEKSLTYSNYLKIEQLLDLQTPRSDPVEHDEELFIIIHQVYELWFKLLLHELEKVRRDFCANRMWEAIATLKRCRMVMKTLVAQLDVLETMSPMSFKSFRDRLESASGFQSAQFRELEFLLGYKRPDLLRLHATNSAAHKSLQRRLRAPSLVDGFYDFLEQRGFEIPRELREKDITEPTRPNKSIQAALLKLYRECPDVAGLLELMTDFDEGLQEWRYRHVKMVERTIGRKPGTGGSAGVDFLRATLFHPVFPDLWDIRHEL